LEKVLESILNFQCEKERFEAIKEVCERDTRNWDLEQPLSQACWHMKFIMREKCWTPQEILASLIGTSLLYFVMLRQHHSADNTLPIFSHLH
jgi:secreted Zn-dependent insulinase-like peptidase